MISDNFIQAISKLHPAVQCIAILAVAAIAIPVTLALTMLIFYLIGYTLNRITLFALIFSIGILVDDAIVEVENIHRYFTTTMMKPLDAAIKAVDEIGNPTVLATFAVIASILPMGGTHWDDEPEDFRFPVSGFRFQV